MKQGRGKSHLTKSRLALLGGALLLAACASNPPAPVEDRSTGDSRPAAESERATSVSAAAPVDERYRVAGGDTLYAIAFKRGIDFRDLAAWNGIAAPYRIFVGQELRLRPPPGSVVAAAPAPSAPSVAAPLAPPQAEVSAPPRSPSVEKSTKPQPSMFEDVSATPPAAAANVPAESVAAAPVAKAPPPISGVPKAPEAPPRNASEVAPAAPKPVEPATPPKPVPAPVAPRTDDHVAELNAGGVRWRWPGEGKIIGTFVTGDQTRQGIDIAGRSGDPVQAAADGEVVYSGNGLLGYGELIIVKHNASFLSAYGHNRARLVKEGERVKAGQQIAEMGSSASSRDELHFEIRKNGKPVNPLDYLPVR
jgi:lipoprotein NlpD